MKTPKIISVANEKGGVGKTTSTLNIAAGLTNLGYKTLVIDLDGQANLTYYLGHTADKTKYTVSDLLYFSSSKYNLDFPLFIATNGENIDYIPSSKMLASITSVLSTVAYSQLILKNILSNSYFSKYDYILIDCRPSLDLLVVNALVASDGLIIPAQAEQFSLDAIYTTLQTFQNIKPLNNKLELYGILLTMVNKRTTIAKEVEKLLREDFKAKVFNVVIPRLTEATTSTCEQKSLISKKSSKLGLAYLNLAKEIIKI